MPPKSNRPAGKFGRSPELPPLWRCPKCGHKFVTRNIWHSCSRYTLEYHFKYSDPLVRKSFNRFLAVVRRCGPVTVVPQKTRIVFMVRMRFGGGCVRKHWFDAGLLLHRRASHPRLDRVTFYPPYYYGHHFLLEKPSDVDGGIAALARESYAIGCQRQLGRKAKGRRE